MPRTGVNRLLSEMVSAHGKGVTAADVLTLGHQFRVSAEAIFRRLEELKRLPAGTWERLRANRFQPDKARTTLGLPLTAREPVLPFRYRMMARNAYDAINSEMTESELAALFRMVRVAVWDELEMLRVLGKSTLADFEKSLGPSEPAHPAPAGVSSALSSSLHLL